VVHRDIKADNILITDGGSRLAISDLGLARLVPEADPLGGAAGKSMTAETGTYRFMAPEVFLHQMYDEGCDVYSFGILAWEMLTFETPFKAEGFSEIEAAFAVAKNAQRPVIPSHCPMAIATQINACWRQVASERPAISEVLKDLEHARELVCTCACTGSPPLHSASAASSTEHPGRASGSTAFHRMLVLRRLSWQAQPAATSNLGSTSSRLARTLSSGRKRAQAPKDGPPAVSQSSSTHSSTCSSCAAPTSADSRQTNSFLSQMVRRASFTRRQEVNSAKGANGEGGGAGWV